MNTNPLEVGNEVAITFYDHSEGSGPCVVIVYGRVAKVDELCVEIDSWALGDSEEDREENLHNVKTFTLLRSTFINVRMYNDGE